MVRTLKNKKVDLIFLITVLFLAILGFFIFSSASLGLLARTENIFRSVTANQAIFGLLGGMTAMFITSLIPYKFWKRYSFHLFFIALILLTLVFVPGIGFGHGGARRWIHIGSFSLQPSEIYKITFVFVFATWLSIVKNKVSTIRFGLIPFLIFTGISALFLLTEPDTATFGVISFAGLCMYITAGARMKHLFIIFLTGLVGITILAFARPYVMDRIHTFMDPSRDPTGKGYQIQQSMIAIGSGGISGRGFGQSIQKFNFLPEPVGDSVFAVAAEEFGFIGGVFIIFLYIFFALRGFKIATHTQDIFGRLTVTGIVILIVAGSMINISSMLGMFPLSGIPLAFISHGGTALFFTLASVGIILNISKYQNT